jgi:hypothetical protein
VTFDGNGRAARIDLEILVAFARVGRVMSGALLGDLKHVGFSGQFESGLDFRGTIGFGSNTSSWSLLPGGKPSPVTLFCLVAQFESGGIPADAIPSGARWTFCLTNLDLDHGDAVSEQPEVPAGAAVGRLRRDRIEIDVLGRQWVVLTHVARGCEQVDGGSSLSWRTELHTDRIGSEDPEAVIELADTLLTLIALGYGRFVAWTVLRLHLAESAIWERSSTAWIPEYRHGGLQHVTQASPGELRSYLESCAPSVAENREWWIVTIQSYLQSSLSPFIELKMSVLVALLDRIVAFVRQEKHWESQIAAGLDDVVETEAFRASLHVLINSYCGAWCTDRTDSLIRTIKEWNSEPSYAQRVRRVCTELDVPPPSAKAIALRHRLLHGYQKPVSAAELDEAWPDIDDAVVLLLLRILGFRGNVYLARPHEVVSMGRITAAGVIR